MTGDFHPVLRPATGTRKPENWSSFSRRRIGVRLAVVQVIVFALAGCGTATDSISTPPYRAADPTSTGAFPGIASVPLAIDTGAARPGPASPSDPVRTAQVEQDRAIRTRPAQPGALIYGDVIGGEAYARSGALVVAGRENYGDPAFRAISRAGGTVLLYLDTIIDNPAGRYHAMLMADSPCGPAVPRWPGLPQVNQWGYLNDFRPGGAEQAKLACVLETMVAENPHMAGWMADDLGSRSWFSGLDWASWSPADQQAYRDGAVEFVKTFREVADAHGLIVIVNGSWSGGTLAAEGGGYPATEQSGNALADGSLVEHHDGEASFFIPYMCSPQWAILSPITRGAAVMFAVTRSDTGRDLYGEAACTAFAVTQTDYDQTPAPWAGFRPTGLPNEVTR